MEEMVLFLRLLLALLFFSTAWSKLKKMGEHIGIVKDYQILPDRLAAPFAKGEVYVELALSVLLVTGLFQQAAALAGAGLLLLYTTAIVINLARGRTEISCGCGGAAGNHQLSGLLVLRNACLIAMAVAVYAVNPALGSADTWLAGGGIAMMLNWKALFILAGSVMSILLWIGWMETQEIGKEIHTFWERG